MKAPFLAHGRNAWVILLLIAAAAVALSAFPPAAPVLAQHATNDAASGGTNDGAAVEEPTEPVMENPTLPPQQEALAEKIFDELISPCCWTTTVAVHGTGAAPRIEAEVRRMIAGGMTHQQILDRYVKQYGERILAKPRKSGFNLTVYWVPYLGILIGAGAIVTTFRRRKLAAAAAAAAPRGTMTPAPTSRGPSSSGPDEEYHRRIEEELRRSS